MARSGSLGFGTTLNPFGGGTLGGFSSYDIGSNLAELEVYKVEVAWGNGTATDEEYLAALGKAVAATSTGTKARETAQNRLDDANYSIGRSKANAVGLDQLIAFDQAALAKMTPENSKYRSVADSLDSELASRRSRDYGELVTKYNAGKISTQALVDWVGATLKTIDSTDPDFRNWTSTAAELGNRLTTEKDSQVYQDYQHGKMKGDAFLAYLTNRRNGYDPTSPDFAEWTRKVEDAQKQVTDTKLAAQDTAFFNAYSAGHKSDAQYLSYLNTRISHMAPDDPDLGSWKYKMQQAAFSIAEDQLRFSVQTGKASVGKLVAFYKNYQRTLNPGSAEWRTIARNLISLHSSGGGGGGGGGGTSKGTAAARVFPATNPKLINTAYTLDNILPLLNVNLGNPIAINALTAAGRKAQRTAEADRKARVKVQTDALALNVATIENARQRGDNVWLFQDPRTPGQMIAGKNPDGSAMLDAKGKPVMVAGSGYLPVTDQAYSNLIGLQTNLHYGLASLALGGHDAAGYYSQLTTARNLEDKQRLVASQYIARSNKNLYDAADKGIDIALKTGDWTAAVNLAVMAQKAIDGDLANPMLDDTRQAQLEAIKAKIAANPILPQVDAAGQRVGGAIDLDNSTFDAKGNATSVSLLPGWHLSLDRTDATGTAKWGPVYDDRQDGTWEQSRVVVHTTYGGQLVTGWVSTSTAPVNSTVVTPDGQMQIDTGAKFLSYTDENGQLVKAYSLDGQTWIRSLTGTIPSIQMDLSGLTLKTDANGVEAYTATVGGKEVAVLTHEADGSWRQDQGFMDANPGMVNWYGIQNVKKFAKTAGYDPNLANQNRQGRVLGRSQANDIETLMLVGARKADVGAPGQTMQVVTMSPSGAIDLASRDQQYKTSDLFATDPFHVSGVGGKKADPFHVPGDGKGATAAPLAPSLTPAEMNRRRGEPTVSTSLAAAAMDRRRGETAAAYRPSIAQQLPADTPSRFDGEGFAPKLSPAISLTSLPAIKTTNIPLPKKVSAPLPKPPVAKSPAAAPTPSAAPSPAIRRTGGGYMA